MDCQISTDEKTDPLWSSTIFVMKDQIWSEIRTSFRPLLSTGKMKTMFYMVDVCSNELAACLEKATVDGKFYQEKNIAWSSYMILRLSFFAIIDGLV
jgi:hypothetical protein